MKDIKYEGIFINDSDVKKLVGEQKVKLEKVINDTHCTFKYKPNEEDLIEDIVGNEYELKVVGYGFNDKNSGYEIEIPEEIKGYYKNESEVISENGEKKSIKSIPHITTSLSKDGKAKDTKDLNFLPLENPITVRGRVGYYIIENGEYKVSFDKVKSPTLNDLLQTKKELEQKESKSKQLLEEYEKNQKDIKEI